MPMSIHSARVYAALRAFWWSIFVVLAMGSLAAAQSVLTQHNDNQRTGANVHETQLTPANVSQSFGCLYTLNVSSSASAGSVQGCTPAPPDPRPNTIGAQPLYVAPVMINGAAHEALYVSTRQNWVFAFDVSSISPAKLLWKIELRDSRGFGAEELPGMEARFQGDGRILCQQTRGPVGIASTPVIDPATNTMWVIYRTSNPLHRVPNNDQILAGSPVYQAKFYLRKMDIRTGTSLGEQEIKLPTSDPNWADRILTRTGLLLMNGVIYVGFAGAVCDDGGGPPDPNDNNPAHAAHAAHGWIVALDASKLTVIAALPTTTQGWMGGIWQSGSGLAADPNGNVFALTGNHEGPGGPELADSLVRVQLAGNRLAEAHYTAPNWKRLDDGDSDPASGGPVVLPNGLVLGGGKPGFFYLMNPASMNAPQQSFQAFYHSWHDGIDPCDNDFDQAYGPNIHGAPVVWHPDGVPYSLVYHMPEKEYLKAFRAFDNGRMEERPFVTTQDSGIRSPRGMPGGALSLSASGGRNGVLWVSGVDQEGVDALNTNGDPKKFTGRLMAFDALTLSLLWQANEHIPFAKYIPPTVGGGKVFRSAYADQIYVYGLASNFRISAPSRGTAGSIVGRLNAGLSPSRPVTAVWRDQNHLDLFMTARALATGNVLSTNWQPGTCPSGAVRAWRGWFPINSDMDAVSDDVPLPAGTVFATSGAAPVTALRAPVGVQPHLDLFVAGNDGQVMSTVWENQPKRPTIQKVINGRNSTVSASTELFPPTNWQKWFPVAPSSISVAPRQPITAVWRPGSSHLDLFTVGRDGRVMSTYFEGTSWQTAWFPVAGNTPITAPGQHVTAVWRNANHLDLFITGKDGKVMSTYFESNKWQPGWFAVNPASAVAAPGQTITALWRNANHLDLFITDNQGRVMSTFFDNNKWEPAWFAVNPASGAAAPGQTVTAVWMNPNHLDLFMTGKDGRVMSTYFDNNRWQPAWFAISPASATAAPGQEVTALCKETSLPQPAQGVPGVCKNASQLDLFITGQDGRVMSIFFENNQWAPAWFTI